jgi:hypothetical protein
VQVHAQPQVFGLNFFQHGVGWERGTRDTTLAGGLWFSFVERLGLSDFFTLDGVLVDTNNLSNSNFLINHADARASQFMARILH